MDKRKMKIKWVELREKLKIPKQVITNAGIYTLVGLFIAFLLLYLLAIYFSAKETNKIYDNNSLMDRTYTAHGKKSVLIDTIVIHGKYHEMLYYNESTKFNGFCHSPECWCWTGEDIMVE